MITATFLHDPVDKRVYVTGGRYDDFITVLHHGDGTLTVSDVVHVLDFSDVDGLVVSTDSGNDVVRYTLDGPLVRGMGIDVYLGDGNDRFTGTLNRDLLAGPLDTDVYGQGGDDLITMYGTPTAPSIANDHLTDGLAINTNGLRIAQGAVLGGHLSGGGGNDRIYEYYEGELNGVVHISMAGGAGEDNLGATVRVWSGSTGRVGSSTNPARMSGGEGSDGLWFYVFNNSGNSVDVNAEIDGGEDPWWWPYDTDTGSRTENVRHTGGIEEDYAF